MFALALRHNTSGSTQIAPVPFNQRDHHAPLLSESDCQEIARLAELMESEYHSHLSAELPRLARTVNQIVKEFYRLTPDLNDLKSTFENYMQGLQVMLVNSKLVLLPQCKKVAKVRHLKAPDQLLAALKMLPAIDQDTDEEFERLKGHFDRFKTMSPAAFPLRALQADVQALHNQVLSGMRQCLDILRQLFKCPVINLPPWHKPSAESQAAVDDLARRIDARRGVQPAKTGLWAKWKDKIKAVFSSGFFEAALLASGLMFLASLFS